jgi:chromate transport protein ChrA
MKKVLNLPAFRFCNEYFLFLLPLFFVLHGYTDHYGEVPAGAAFRLAMEYLVVVLVTSLVLAFIFKSFRKASLFTFLLFSFYFFFGAGHDWFKDLLGDVFLVSYSFILPFVFIIFIILFIYVKRTGRPLVRVTCYLNTLLVLLLIVDLVLLLIKPAMAQPLPMASNIPSHQTQPVPSPTWDTGAQRDIHLIIADEYAGTQALKEVLKFDNSAFEDSLRRRGFYVVDSPRSNYNYTVASMASLFQMEYLPGIKDRPDEEIYQVSKALINKNNFVDFMAGKGYSIRNFSVFNFAGQPPFAEPYFPQYLELITGNTFLARVKKDIGYHAALTFRISTELEKVKESLRWEADAESRKMDSVLREMATLHPAPQFFYTHLMMPHDPYLYDKNENLVRLEFLLDPEQKRDEYKLYLGYLQYANKQLLHFIDRILKTSAKPPVILLMSDHGFRRGAMPRAYHFSNINAVFIPGGNYNGFYPGLSNVNQLRLLLNKQFKEHLPLHQDSSIFLGTKSQIHEKL